MQAFIFDFDGVIVDSQKYWDLANTELYPSLSQKTLSEEDFLKVKNLGVMDAYELLRKDYGYEASREEFLKTVGDFAIDLYLTKTKLIDGIIGLIERLQTLH